MRGIVGDVLRKSSESLNSSDYGRRQSRYLFGVLHWTGDVSSIAMGAVALTPNFGDASRPVEKHGLVEKAELMQAVWPETAVEEGNLTQNVYNLRRLLGDRAESGVAIETVPRRGYRLVGEVLQETIGSVSLELPTTPATPSGAVAESRDSGELPLTTERLVSTHSRLCALFFLRRIGLASRLRAIFRRRGHCPSQRGPG